MFGRSCANQLADPGQLPDNELFKAVQFSDGSNEAFLRRLWHDLYGGESEDLSDLSASGRRRCS